MDNIYIKSLPVNLFEGIFTATINFENGLNLISGVNGTGKTQVLQLLKNNVGITSSVGKKSGELNMCMINPKRNVDKQTIESIIQQTQTQNKTIRKFIDELKTIQTKDFGFTSYPSFAELFVQEYEELMKCNSQIGYGPAVEETAKTFNEVLSQVFPDYQINAEWVSTGEKLSGQLEIGISKYSAESIPTDKLSTGERDVLALLFCIFLSRNDEDVYLIDEPEIHLNWDLENGLFNFLNWFCDKYHKQAIVVTHSRIIFDPEFYNKTQFLAWDNNKIICRQSITQEQKSSIAGEVLNSINIMELDKPIFFVEDQMHKAFITHLTEALNKGVEIIICKNKQNVKNMFDLLRKQPSSTNNTYFLIDGDNEGFNVTDKHFIVLHKFCMENYLLNPFILSKTLGVTEESILDAIIKCVKDLKDANLMVYSKLAEVASPFPLEILDTFDASKIIKKLLSQFSEKKIDDIIKLYIDTAKKENKLDTIFQEIVVKLD